jgi:hypothetical protein
MKGNATSNQGVVPLRTILRNFLNLVDNYEASVKDGLDLYEKEFQVSVLKTHEKCVRIRKGSLYTRTSFF